MNKPPHRPPLHPLDADARRAFRRYVDKVSRNGDVARDRVAARWGLDLRTVERLYAGRAAIPAGLAGEIVRGSSSELSIESSTALSRWADHCRQQEKRHG